MSLRPGQQIDRYIVENLIGAGGMAEVWAVRHRVLGTRHALKLLSGARVDHRRRLLQEGRAQARLNHPHLLPVRDVLTVEGQPALLLPLIDGPSLEGLLARYRPSLPEALALLYAITDGLAHAHREGFTHRDLKPGNVLLDLRQGRVQPRIGDFGLVKSAVVDERPTTLAGVIFGTPAYIAPEQIEDASTVDPRADVFSLGVMMVEVLTGERPFVGRTPAELRHAHAQPLQLAAIPATQRALVHDLLRRDPEERPADAQAVLARLETISVTPLSQGSLMRAAQRVLRPTEPPAPVEAVDALDSRSTMITQARAGTNLPAQRDRFIGRSEERKILRRHFRDGVRLVTVTGFGGVGKTRLAVELGREDADRWSGGVWLVDLTDARAAEDVLAAVGRALDVPLGRAPAVQLAEALRGRNAALLILDNFEQVAHFAKETVGFWLDRVAGVTFLVTSRTQLRLRGEQVLPLEPLPTEAGRALFVERAAAAGRPLDHEAERATLTALVAALDGLPLAIELAAARARTLSPKMLYARLAQRFRVLTSRSPELPARQRTLRATLQWSWDLLAPWARAALAQLSVFDGGFSFEDAEAVLDLTDFTDPPWIEDALAELVEKSLLRVSTDPRFSMLLSVQAFAREQLATPRSVERRHGLRFAMPTDRSIPEQLADLDNRLAAFRRAVARDDATVAVPVGMILQNLYNVRGPFPVGARLLQQARQSMTLTDTQRATLMRGEAWLRCQQAEYAKGQALLEGALTLHRRAGDRRNVARVKSGLGLLLFESQGRAQEAFLHLEAALQTTREIGAKEIEVLALSNLGVVYDSLSDFDEAEACYRGVLQIHQEIGSLEKTTVTHANLINVYLNQGRLDEALKHGKLGLRLARESGNRVDEAIVLLNLGAAYARLERFEEARAHFQAALVIHREIGNRRFVAITLGNLGQLLAQAGQYEQARPLLEDAVDRAEQLSFASAEGAFRATLGQTLYHLGDASGGAEHFSRGETLLRAAQHRLELGKLLCSRAQVRWTAQQPDAARRDLDEARRLAAALDQHPDADLPRMIASLADQMGGPPPR